jgi:Leucine-rich repeat (LRR) protein
MAISHSSHRHQLLMYFLLVHHLLLLIQLSYSLGTYSSSQTFMPPPAAAKQVQCHPGQASALLRLGGSISSTNDSACTLASWRAGTDCCAWEGVACGGGGAVYDGRVTSLDLGGCGLEIAGFHPALFDLTSLRYLDLSQNSLNESELPADGFERLTELTHLNLSYSDFKGTIPRGIRRLNKLVSLDFTNWIYLVEGDNDYFLPLGEGRWPVVEPDIGSLVANLSNLKELYLGTVDLSGNGAAWCSAFANSTPHLQVLSLPHTNLNSPICGSLSLIHSLTKVNLKYNKVNGRIPESFADLPSLSVLRLAYNLLEGPFPMRIFQNKNLTAVDITYNFKVSGFLPNFSSDSIMTELLCSNTNFSGPIPSSISNLKSLKKLGIAATDFHRELPSSIGELRSLTTLQVSGAGIVGEIPSWVSNLTSLELLQFSNCGLYGQVPSFIGNLEKLSVLKLYACNFSGQLPPHLFNLTNLGVINFHSNSFSGTMELSSFFKLPSLFSLNLSNNKLSMLDSEYNSSWESIDNFDTLCLASCNISKLPDTLRHMHSVEVLDLSNNHINGIVPQWAWDNWIHSIILMNLSYNQFSSSIGYGSVISANMFVIDISYNLFEGPLPIPGPQNQLLDCSYNQFSSIPFNFGSHLSSISLLMASGNNLSGEIPPSLCEATGLKLLDLSNNDLNGSIPFCLMKDMSQLNVLNLRGNQLRGRLPNSVKQGCAFGALDFSDNQIEGQLPRSLAACKDLEVFDIGNNLIDDTFPCWMSMLPKLQVLVLRSNKFVGNVGPSVSGDNNDCEFMKLRIFVLASNNFVGFLQNEWFRTMKSMMTKAVNETLVMENQYGLLGQTYQFTTAITYKGSDITFSKILRTIVIIDVSDNAFYGAIPQSIGDLVLLSAVNMSHNALTGLIPSQLGMLHQLESLDLSWNDLSGEIPQELASLDFLSMLNLSYNKLDGRIPQSPHFLTFSNLSFLGNIGLCGLEVSKACDNMTPDIVLHHQSERLPIDIVLFLFAGLGFGIGFAIAVVLAWGISWRSLLDFKTTAVSYPDNNALPPIYPAASTSQQLQLLNRGQVEIEPRLAGSSGRCDLASKPLSVESSSTRICVPVSS